MAQESQEFIINRAQKTAAVYAAIVGDWEWEVMDLAEFTAAKAEVEAFLDVVEGLRMTMLEKRDALDAQLAVLHGYQVLTCNQARAKWQLDPLKHSVLGELSARGGSRVAMLDEARTLAKAWPKLDAAWVPVGGLALAAFQALRVTIEGVDTATPPTPGLADNYDIAYEAWRAQADVLSAMLGELETTSEAWYKMATAVFAAGTAQGDLIRGQVPTTYDPAHEPLPLPGAPTGFAAAPGAASGTVDVVCLPVTYATGYGAVARWNDGSPQDQVASFSTNTGTFSGLPPGVTVQIALFATNASGSGPECAAVSVTVP